MSGLARRLTRIICPTVVLRAQTHDVLHQGLIATQPVHPDSWAAVSTVVVRYLMKDRAKANDLLVKHMVADAAVNEIA